MHDLEFDHIHPNAEQKEQLSDAIWSADNVEFTTVGVDVGSSTSHLMFAKVHLQRLAEALSSRFVVVSREILWKSPILLTPYRLDYTIDAEDLGDFVDRAYRQAGLTPDDIDSGAVILTGEALKRTNARAIANLFADQSGKFVCASAGHNLEALMAAHGSGAVELSRKEHKTFLNIDIGGGTTKFALVHGGKLLESAAIAVGGRLVAYNEKSELVRIEGPAEQMAAEAGFKLELGQVLSAANRQALTKIMVDILIGIIGGDKPDKITQDLMVTPGLPATAKIDAITFSGGVSEFIFGRETAAHGDLGGDLADAIKSALEEKRIAYPVYDPGQGIRATVVGASQFTVQVSGNTIHISDLDSLPVRNIPVIRLDLSLAGDIDPAAITAAINKSLARFDIDEGESTVALAFTWEGDPEHSRMYSLAKGIVDAFPKTVVEARQMILVMEGDIGKSLGVILKNELGVTGDLISLDGVQLQEFDYIDIGELIQPTDVAPLIIKSLLFTSEEQSGGDHHHHHTHTHD
ncbi:MAG: ethanolamine ammonia-lyase reactivating factor EutA [Rhodospirillales bacterium]|nr:ethanolamine ammonia-lyase reactivating factor EutA [Rhodospirillales bacterium]